MQRSCIYRAKYKDLQRDLEREKKRYFSKLKGQNNCALLIFVGSLLSVDPKFGIRDRVNYIILEGNKLNSIGRKVKNKQ